MKQDWRSWKTEGAWMTDGTKQTLDDIGAAVIVLFFVGVYIWIQWP